MPASENILLQKLNQFIDKYYLNQVYKGLILTASVSLIALFLISLLEYFGRFSSQVRLTLLISYALSVGCIAAWYLIRPSLGLFKINRKLNHRTAAKIIGNHFPQVKDKLLNALELSEQSAGTNNSLLLASIEQRTKELRPIPFVGAIDFKKNLTYVKYALAPALILLAVLLISPGFKKSTERVVRYAQAFEEEAPFEFIVDPNSLDAVQNETVEIHLGLEGDQIPQSSYIYVDGMRYKMRALAKNQFEFKIPNIQQSSSIYFEAGGFNSTEHIVKVALKPSLLSYHAKLIFPAYLKRQAETVSNMGELTIPQGTRIEWNFNTQNVDHLDISPSVNDLTQKEDQAIFTQRYMQSSSLKVLTSNSQVKRGDSLNYSIQVIPDLFPKIRVSSETDSFSAKVLYFIGDLKDDHGFSRLSFHYEFENQKENTPQSGSMDIPVQRDLESQTFYHLWNLNSLNIEPSDELVYYFTVWDNDGVNGPKRTQTTPERYKAPSLEEIEQQTEKSNQEIKEQLSGSQSEASELENEIQDVERMLTEKENLDWNDKKKIEDLLKKHEALQKQVQETIKKNLEKNLKEEEFKPQNERIAEKQKKLEELFDEVMDDEMKELMEKIRELMEKNKTDELQQKMEQLQFSEKELSKELDRMLELFKELELEKKLQETVDKLNELAEKQEKLAEKTANSDKDEALEKEQEELNKQMDKLKEDLKDISEKDRALEKPKGLEPPMDKQEDARSDMQDASDKMDKGKNQKASEKQKDAAEKMKEMANEMQEQMDQAYQEQQEEDIQSLRQILENLIQLSFDQEDVQEQFKEHRSYSPKYIELRQLQRKIKDDSRIVEDSLLALSKRALEIQHFVNEEIAKINQNLDKTLEYLGERQTRNALVHQQLAMTGYNNLALMLSQSLDAMQQQMKSQQQQQGEPKANCKKPGNGNNGKNKKPNMNAIKKLQQELAKQMQEMANGMKKGKKPGSKEFAEMAAKQAAIRKMMRDLERELNKEGQGRSLGDLKRTQDMMDDLEKDLYYKKLDDNTLSRLQQIEIRLSEHEKAEKEQEQDKKRSSTEAEDMEKKIPPAIKKYLDEKNKQQEQLKKVSPELNPYYEKKVKDFFQQG